MEEFNNIFKKPDTNNEVMIKQLKVDQMEVFKKVTCAIRGVVGVRVLSSG